MKNELIIARQTRGHARQAAAAAGRLREIAGQFGLEPLLQTRFKLPPPAAAVDGVSEEARATGARSWVQPGRR